MRNTPSLDDLWNTAPPARGAFDLELLPALPDGAQRYLRHAIADRAPLVSAVRLRMRGEIKLKRWLPFSGEEVIVWGRGMIWRATVRMFGLPVRGADRLIDGEAELRWGLFGILPVMHAAGPDITRSAAGRVNIESIWLPSILSAGVRWAEPEPGRLQAGFTAHGEVANMELRVSPGGSLRSVSLPRWGNPDGGLFHHAAFGAIIEEEGRFDGYTIPTRVRVGWRFGTEQFESEGEFFRAKIDSALFR